MKNRPSRVVAGLAVAIFALAGMDLGAQDTPEGQNANDEGGFITDSRLGDILLADVGAFGGGFAAVGLNFLALWALGTDGELSLGDQMLGSAVTELSDIPLFLSGSPDALALSLGGAALWGGEALADWGYGNYSRQANFLYWGKIDLAMYKAYDSYASLRLKSGAWDNSAFRRYGALELMAAPLDYRLYAKPQPWIALAAGIAVNVLPLLTKPSAGDTAVWTTGRWFLGEEETTPGAFLLEMIPLSAISSAYTGVGEEAVYRGFMHEELSVHLGKPWATVIDTGAFLAMHLFTDMARGMEWDAIGEHLLFVAGGNLLLDWAYDEGGMPLAVTCHALTDFGAFMMLSLMYNGTAQVSSGH